MSDTSALELPVLEHRTFGTKEDASFQVIVLGSSGGPREDTVAGLLVRSPQSEWRKSSVIAVDAGAHLASIIAILQRYMPYKCRERPSVEYSKVLENGPFAGVEFHNVSAKANALYIFRELLHSFLITHPHLDHLSALGINTPALEYGREAKAIVALPSVIEAIKVHIFNDTIWPNLSDEGNGVGFVTYRRLTEGGNLRLGSGEARGYVSVCDGLATKCLAVTHGKCQRHHHGASHHQRGESGNYFTQDYSFTPRRLSRMSDHESYMASVNQQQMHNNHPQMSATPMTPSGMNPMSAMDKDPFHEPVTSSAFFIRNDVTGKEILIFGDIEPDSVSIAPRNHLVWDEAAPKVANGILKAMFIECSFDDNVRDADLFGHLCPRHLIAELDVLARKVIAYKEKRALESKPKATDSPHSPRLKPRDAPSNGEPTKKRKRGANGESVDFDGSPGILPQDSVSAAAYVGQASSSQHFRQPSREGSAYGIHSPYQRPLTPSRVARQVQLQGSPRMAQSQFDSIDVAGATAYPPLLTTPAVAPTETVPPDVPPKEKLPEPLKGLTVHIIHVKDTMMDGPSPGETIADQVREHANTINLGCEFDVTDNGESIWI